MSTFDDQSRQKGLTAALEHKLQAIQALGSILLKEECFGLGDSEEELALAMVLILVLHDVSNALFLIIDSSLLYICHPGYTRSLHQICESGRSLHGTHLNGVAFLCSRIVTRPNGHTAFKNFLLASLSW